jgi:hypothetical protein
VALRLKQVDVNAAAVMSSFAFELSQVQAQENAMLPTLLYNTIPAGVQPNMSCWHLCFCNNHSCKEPLQVHSLLQQQATSQQPAALQIVAPAAAASTAAND